MSDVRERRLYLIGESNPYGNKPEFALYPYPERAAGGRLARVLGLTPLEYLRTFRYRRNLLSGNSWSVRAARRAATQLLEEVQSGDVLILLGARVTAAFGLDFKSLVLTHTGSSHQLKTVRVGVLPHPSGRNRVWNRSGIKEQARVLVEELLGLVEGVKK